MNPKAPTRVHPDVQSHAHGSNAEKNDVGAPELAVAVG
jgi:hypothetical protein